MSELKRYNPAQPMSMDAVPHGEWVRYDDAQASIEQARREERERCLDACGDARGDFPSDLKRLAGFHDGIDACIRNIRKPEEASDEP